MKKKQFIKAIVFCGIVLTIFIGLTRLLIPKWISGTSATYVTQGMYEEPKNTIDVCFLGSSQTVYAISSMRLLEKYGINAYSCSTGSQPMLCTYYYLKEFDKRQNFKTVMLDTSMLYEEEEESRFHNTIDSAPFSMEKLKLIWEHCKSENADSIWTYLFPIGQYHTRWSELSKKDFKYKTMNENIFKGNNLSAEVKTTLTNEDFGLDTGSEDAEIVMNEAQLYWFRQIYAYCQENDIELILFKSPKIGWGKTKMLGTEQLAQECGLAYYDFNTTELMTAMNFNAGTDMWNNEHMNIKGAYKLTDYIAQHILVDYQSSSQAAIEAYGQEKVEKFIESAEMKNIQATVDIEQLFLLLQDEKLDIVVVKSADMGAAFTQQEQAAWEGLGAAIPMQATENTNYAACFTGQSAAFEQTAAEKIEYSLQLSDGAEVSMTSDINSDETKIVLKGRDIDFKRKGLNIIVYDSMRHKTIDRITICYDAKTSALKTWHRGVYTGEE